MKLTTPKADGFYMPAEFEPHSGSIMIWPERPGSWPFGATAARKAFAEIASAISESETVYMLVNKGNRESAEKLLPERVKLVEIETDDAWARDTGPTFVKNDNGEVRGISWKFNAWGGDFDGLYAHWEKDDRVADTFCEHFDLSCYDARPFVLEGGSVHSDGQGTLLVTEACLLSGGRNPQLSMKQIEERLAEYLGAEKVIWLPRGIYNDETNEHVDNICAFTKAGEVVLAWTDDETDPQYELSKSCLDVLERETDAKGRQLKIHKLPIPERPVCISEEELCGFDFEEGEDMREAGERLAASYVNFYISNSAVILPQFGDKNDSLACEIMSEIFPERKIIPVYARDIIVGGGNIHCITQQIPKGVNIK